MEIIKLCGIAVLTAVSAALLRKDQPVFAMFLGVAGSLLLFGEAIGMLHKHLAEWQGLFGQESTYRYGGILLRCLGTALAVELAADICRDAGEAAVAGRLELAGKITILILSLPLLNELLSVVGELLQ